MTAAFLILLVGSTALQPSAEAVSQSAPISVTATVVRPAVISLSSSAEEPIILISNTDELNVDAVGGTVREMDWDKTEVMRDGSGPTTITLVY